MKVNGTEIPDTLYTGDGIDAKGKDQPWRPTGAFTSEGLKNVRYTYEREVNGKKASRWFKARDFKPGAAKATSAAAE
jgi:hypothetical protein